MFTELQNVINADISVGIEVVFCRNGLTIRVNFIVIINLIIIYYY